ncbi:hypothetical protein [Kitasatospora sp. NPDC086791]|uniref:hypothetical protein n=1 Tax=Kitasatospora sp. NPDC086791 TaxID=3155178 RepID=UPI00343F9DFB
MSTQQVTDTDPLVRLLARAAAGDRAAQKSFLAARESRQRMNERLDLRARAAAWRMLDRTREDALDLVG